MRTSIPVARDRVARSPRLRGAISCAVQQVSARGIIAPAWLFVALAAAHVPNPALDDPRPDLLPPQGVLILVCRTACAQQRSISVSHVAVCSMRSSATASRCVVGRRGSQTPTLHASIRMLPIKVSFAPAVVGTIPAEIHSNPRPCLSTSTDRPGPLFLPPSCPSL